MADGKRRKEYSNISPSGIILARGGGRKSKFAKTPPQKEGGRYKKERILGKR